MPQMLNGRFLILKLAGLVVLSALTGCQTAPDVASDNNPAQFSDKSATEQEPSEVIYLREGDVLRITLPGAGIDVTQPIRRDGMIVLPMAGELKAVGKTPAQLEQEVLGKIGSELISKEITVTVVTSFYPVFVTGSVLRPGKVLSDHPMSALEAVMEAGGFDYSKANLKAVTVIRQEGKQTKTFTINLKRALQQRENDPFYLKPQDIVYVPERFTWF